MPAEQDNPEEAVVAVAGPRTRLKLCRNDAATLEENRVPEKPAARRNVEPAAAKAQPESR